MGSGVCCSFLPLYLNKRARRSNGAFQLTEPCVKASVKISTEPALTSGTINAYEFS